MLDHRLAPPAERTDQPVISILGPLELTGPRGPIRLTARRQQILVGALVWQANRVVSIDSLIDVMWGTESPSTARSQVHISVSGVRKRLARAGLHRLIDTEPPGYLARVGPGKLDAHRFDELAELGRTALAAGRLSDADQYYAAALRLWRGDPFSGLRNEHIESIAARLCERRITLSENHFDVRIMLGRSADIISEVVPLVAKYPFRERLRAQLMIALSRSGRTMEALRVYQETRQLFVSELGVEPGPVLRDLEQEILTGTASRIAQDRFSATR
ncbi:AfsR/SARP family transcriptional regulator [Amycolatopsis mediterranei]|uniref:AfsR/SARP family transcriptional regulator n=1 Tax=Amycolatopsis mediterranei TaxID=33910 RepID=UPI003440BD3D